MAEGEHKVHQHTVGPEWWINKWETETNPGWRMQGVNPYIKKYQDKLTRGLQCAKVFFPMCGDVADMAWLADIGHTVVGVEISSLAIEKFFKDNNIEFTVTPVAQMGGTVYTDKNDSIRIYCGDFFRFGPSIEKDFDGIWDRGSMNTLEDLETREKYVKILKSVMKSDGNVLLEFVIYEENCVDFAEIRNLFGNDFKMIDLESVDSQNYAPEYVDFNVKFQLFYICKIK